MNNLIISGGIYHDFAATSAVLSEILCRAGIDSQISPTAKQGLARLGQGERFDMLTFNCLIWSMTQHSKYEPFRDEYAHHITQSEIAAIESHVAAGKSILAFHTAPICFDSWPGWGDLLGMKWVWGQSSHPTPRRVDVTPVDPVKIPGFSLEDELYCNLIIHPDLDILATATCDVVKDPQPIVTHRITPAGGGVAVCLLGHGVASMGHPDHQKLLLQLVDRLL